LRGSTTPCPRLAKVGVLIRACNGGSDHTALSKRPRGGEVAFELRRARGYRPRCGGHVELAACEHGVPERAAQGRPTQARDGRLTDVDDERGTDPHLSLEFDEWRERGWEGPVATPRAAENKCASSHADIPAWRFAKEIGGESQHERCSQLGHAGIAPKAGEDIVNAANAETGFEAWPNAAQDHVTVNFSHNAGAKHFELVDAIGRVVFEQEIRGSDPIQITTAALPSGLYVGRLASASGISQQKIIVRH
jgi:hypothetical protein